MIAFSILSALLKSKVFRGASGAATVIKFSQKANGSEVSSPEHALVNETTRAIMSMCLNMP